LAAWAVWLVEVLAALFLSGAYREVWDWWLRWNAASSPWEVAGAVVATAALLLALTWNNLIAGLCVALTGREAVMRGGILAFMGLFTAAATVACLAVGNPRLQEAVLRAVPWALGAAVALKAALACWVVRSLLRSGLVPARTVWAFLGIWSGVAAALVVLAIRSVPGEYVAPASLAAGVVLSLPLARLAATPLALAWDRHR
jgi:hypothetical protein